MEWSLKALLGAAVVVLVSLLARSKNYYLAGLVPLFPTFTLIAHYTVGRARSPAELKITILFSLWAILPYVLYLLGVYMLCDRMPLPTALFCSALLWVVAAAVLLLLWGHLAGATGKT